LLTLTADSFSPEVLMGLRLRKFLEDALRQCHARLDLIPAGVDLAPSYVLSPDDFQTAPGRRLLELSQAAVSCALDIELQDVAARFDAKYARYINIWPGEHYKLLAALTKIIAPRKVIEIGTYTGASFLAIKKFLPPDAVFITYDIIAWHHFRNTGLRTADFDSQHQQRTVDLADAEAAKSQLADLENAELIFVDAEKDGQMERRLCRLFDSLAFRTPPLVVFDDIRLVNMIKIWREIAHPKLDLTSFGHWSGTGLVEWK
jgi:predicted O-methyltransferase YrrM